MSRITENCMEWFGVKLLHRIIISGMPDKDKIDVFYHDVHEFYEESIILVKASSFDEAYQLAEREAEKCNDVYINKYGQTVEHEFYRSIDCYHLFNSPRSLTEVYSTFFSKEQDEDENRLFNKRYNSSTIEEMQILRHA